MVALLGTFVPTPDTIEHEVYLGDGPDGPQWATAVSRLGRIEHGEKRIQTPDGRVVVLTATIFLLGHEGEVSTQDKLNGRTVEQVATPTWWDSTPMHHEAGVV
ncbi:hypothetical protein [Actinophytocola sediminis]